MIKRISGTKDKCVAGKNCGKKYDEEKKLKRNKWGKDNLSENMKTILLSSLK